MNVAAIESWLRDHAGLDASTLGSDAVARGVRERMKALACAQPDEYRLRLLASADEQHALVETLVVPETWFFRDRPALEAVARHITETWAPAHPGETCRILSVPCSTGEEPFSIAMALALAGWPLDRTQIDAVDISRQNLRAAEHAVYARNSFRGDDLRFREAFFTPESPTRWKIVPSLRRPIHFACANLCSPDFAAGRAPYDAVFCRNLLIYFDAPTQARAVATLERLLAPGGWLAVGPAEAVLFLGHGFSSLPVPAGFLLHRSTRAPQRPTPSLASAAAPRPAPRPRKPRPQARDRQPPASTPAITLEHVRQLADAGRLAEASAAGEALLARQGADPELLFVLGVVAEAGGDLAGAENFLRKALYLAPTHADALGHLALIASRRGDERTARQLRQRAVRASGRAGA